MVLIIDMSEVLKNRSKSPSPSAALPIAHVVLRILIVLNWLGGAAILALLVVIPNDQWIMSAFRLSPSPDTDRLILGLRAIAVLGLGAIPLNHAILKRLLAMVEEQRNYTAGEFEGIGAYVEMRDGFVTVVTPIDNSPAQAAGVQPGFVVLEVDGQDMAGLTLQEVVDPVEGEGDDDQPDAEDDS